MANFEAGLNLFGARKWTKQFIAVFTNYANSTAAVYANYI